MYFFTLIATKLTPILEIEPRPFCISSHVTTSPTPILWTDAVIRIRNLSLYPERIRTIKPVIMPKAHRRYPIGRRKKGSIRVPSGATWQPNPKKKRKRGIQYFPIPCPWFIRFFVSTVWLSNRQFSLLTKLRVSTIQGRCYPRGSSRRRCT